MLMKLVIVGTNQHDLRQNRELLPLLTYSESPSFTVRNYTLSLKKKEIFTVNAMWCIKMAASVESCGIKYPL